MQTQTNSGGVSSYLLLAGIVLIVLNGYYFTYGVWESMGLNCGITDRFLATLARTGVFRNPLVSQSLTILLLLVSQVGGGTAHPGRGSVKGAIIGMIAGLGLYFGSLLMLSLAGDPAVECGMYFGMEFTGMGMVLWAEGRLFGLWKARLETGKRFGEAEAGFPQETRKLNSAFALTLRARYLYKGRWQPSRINVINPRRGIMILGNPGSGKSRFLIEPIIRQLVEKGVALFVYDFKFDTLTNHTWQLFQQYRDRYPPETKFYIIHFDKARYSHRCNLLYTAT